MYSGLILCHLYEMFHTQEVFWCTSSLSHKCKILGRYVEIKIHKCNTFHNKILMHKGKFNTLYTSKHFTSLILLIYEYHIRLFRNKP